MRFRYFTLVVFFFLPNLLAAHSYPSLHFTTENGLPSNTVYDVYRDSKGYIWIGTDKGVARYDGVSFKIFNTANGLPDNEAFFFQEDYDHRIWVGSYTGALCYFQDGEIHNATNTVYLRLPFKPSVTTHITLQRDSSIIISYSVINSFINIKGFSSAFYTLPDTILSGGDVINIDKVDSNTYEIIQLKDKWYYNVLSHTCKRLALSRLTHFSICQNQKFFYDSLNIYSSAYKVLSAIPPDFKSAIGEYPWDRCYLHKIYFDGQDYIGAMENGLAISNGSVILKNIRISGVTQDKTGSYWVSTLSQGLYRFNKNIKESTPIIGSYSGVVTFAYSDGNTLFFATNNRILYKLGNDSITLLIDFGQGKSDYKIINNHIDCSVNNNKIYCTAADGSIFIYDINAHTQKKIVLKKTHHLTVEHSKKILATNSGLYFYSTYNIDYLDYRSLYNGAAVYKRLEKDNGPRIYDAIVDTVGYILFTRAGVVTRIINDLAITQPQFGTNTFKWLQLLRDRVVGCTPDNRLFLFNNYYSYTTKDSVANNIASWDRAFPLTKNSMLLTSGSNYYMLSLDKVQDKLSAPRIVENPFVYADADYVFSDSSGCYFFKNGSISVMDKTDVLEQPPLPTMFFTNIKMQDTIYHLQNDQFVFPSNDSRTANINLDVLGFNAAGIVCEYCILGQGAAVYHWQPIINNEINFILPAYGTIEILARARTLSGKFSKPIHLTLVIPRPWWARWPSIILAIVLAFIIVYLLARYFIKRTLKQKEAKQADKVKVLVSEFKALNALMSPHFIFNTINQVQGFINDNDKLSASEYIRSLSDLVRQNMENVSRDLISLGDEMMVVENYLKLEQLRYERIQYKIDIGSSVDINSVLIPPLLIQPLVENSIKHGLQHDGNNNTFISIVITKDDSNIKIEVVDNGSGISKSNSAAHTSFALSAIKKRIDALAFTHSIKIDFELSEIKEGALTTGVKAVVLIYV